MMRVGVAGKTRTVSLRGGCGGPEGGLSLAGQLGPAIQRIAVTAIGGGPVNVDAVAVEGGPHHPRGG